MNYSVVVPVYRNEATLPDLLAQLAQLRGDFAGGFEVVFVIDGSPDNSHALRALSRAALGDGPSGHVRLSVDIDPISML